MNEILNLFITIFYFIKKKLIFEFWNLKKIPKT